MDDLNYRDSYWKLFHLAEELKSEIEALQNQLKWVHRQRQELEEKMWATHEKYHKAIEATDRGEGT